MVLYQTGNYQSQEFDWLKSILKGGGGGGGGPTSRPVMFCKLTKNKIIDHLHLSTFIYGSAKDDEQN